MGTCNQRDETSAAKGPEFKCSQICGGTFQIRALWLLGLPSVGRYDARGTRRARRAAIYVNHFCPCLWVRLVHYWPHQAKVGPWYRGPFLAKSIAWLMVAGRSDKIRRPDQTLLAEWSRECSSCRGAAAECPASSSRGGVGTTETHIQVILCLQVLFLFQTSLLLYPPTPCTHTVQAVPH